MGIDKSLWANVEELRRVATSGFNHLFDLEPLLQRFMPGFSFCFADPDELADLTAKGWVIMKPDHFPGGIDDFNAQIALRFGLDHRDGAIWYKNTVLCIMPTEVKEDLARAREEASEEQFRAAVESQRRAEEVVGPRNVESGYAEKRGTVAELAVEEANETKRRGGRRRRS